MSPTTLNERLLLIDAGENVLTDIAARRLEPKAVVHAAQSQGCLRSTGQISSSSSAAARM